MALRWWVVTATDTTVDITDRVRLPHTDEEKPGASVGANAEEGSGASVTIEIDDPNGDLHLLNHRRIYAIADDAPAGHQRVGNWWISDLDVVWAEPFQALSRTWIVQMEDENSIIPRKILVGDDCKRPAETDIERILWWLTTTEGAAVKDTLYLDTEGPVDLDKADLTGQTADGLLSSAHDASGKNYFIWFNELAIAGGTIVSSSVANPTIITTTAAHNLITGAQVTISGHTGSTPVISGTYTITRLTDTTFSIPVNVTVGGTGGTIVEPRYSLAYFDFNTYELYESAIRLSNVDSEIDGVTTFALSQDVKLNRAGGRIASGNYKPYDGGYVYVQNLVTRDRYVSRDVSSPAVNTKKAATALAEATRQLDEMTEPDDVVTTILTVQEANVNAAMHGMRIAMHASHLPNFIPGTSDPGYPDRFVWMRINRRTVSQLAHTTLEIALTLTPTKPKAIEQYYTDSWPLGGCLSTKWPALPGGGNLLVAFIAQRGHPGGFDTNLIGTNNNPGACASTDIAGTGWTQITGLDVATGGYAENGDGGPITMAWRNSVAGEPQKTSWNAPTAPGEHSRTHHVEIAGLAGAPTVTATSHDQTTGGSVFTSPNIVVTGAGHIFAGMSYNASGPSDGASSSFVMTARAPAVGLTEGYAGQPGYGDYYWPNSWFGYLKIAGAGTYNIVLDRSAVPRRNGEPYGWIMGFWPL